MRLKKKWSFVLAAFLRGAGALSMMLLYLVTARIYDVGTAGKIFISLTIATIAIPVSLVGLSSFATKNISKLNDVSEKFRIAKTIIVSAIFFASLATSTLVLISNFFDIGIPIYVVLGAFLVSPISAVIGYIFQGLGRYNSSLFILTICNNFILTLTMLASYYFIGSTQFESFASLYLGSTIATLLIALSLLAFSFYSHRQGLDRDFSAVNADNFHESLRLWLVMLLVTANAWLPSIAFYLNGTPDDYAYFSTSERLANAINFPLIVSSFVLAPIAANLFFDHKVNELKQQFVLATRLAFAAAIIPTLLFLVFPSFFLSFFGSKYAEFPMYLIVMSLGQIFNVATGSVNTLLNMCGAERKLMVSIFCGIVMQVLTIVVLQNHFQALSYAFAYSFGLVTQNLIASYYLYQLVGFTSFAAFKPRRR